MANSLRRPPWFAPGSAARIGRMSPEVIGRDLAAQVRAAICECAVDRDAAADVVRRYVTVGADGTGYTGRAFDTLRTATSDPDAITSDDLVAVSMLAIQIRSGRGAIQPESIIALNDRASDAGACLKAIPRNRELHSISTEEFAHWMGSGSVGEQLWSLIRECGFGSVATHKLLARKRPLMFPIRDSRVSARCGFRKEDLWWSNWWNAFRCESSELIGSLLDVRARTGVVASHLGLLRVADILLWMDSAGGDGAASSDEDASIDEDSDVV